jgi:DNA (cytosine-5)-methyltransferase 1
VQSDLEAEGYEVFSYVLPAASINAPHRRDRVFFIAHSNNNRFNGYDCKSEVESNIGRIDAFDDINEVLSERNSTNTDCEMLEHRNGERKTGGRAIQEKRIKSFNGTRKWETFPTVSPICSGDDGISDRLDSITFSKWRKQTIMAGGNAVVPQLIYVLFKTIQQYESRTN